MRGRPTWPWPAVVIVLAAVVAALFTVPTGQYLITPGVTANLDHIVHVSGATPPKRGRILMVAVSVEPANWLQVLTAQWRPGEELLPKASLMPAGMNFNQYVKLSMLQMKQSHDAAKAAAFRAMGMPVTTLTPVVYVGGVEANGPSSGKLQVMDQIERVNGQSVHSAAKVVSIMHGLKAGTVVHLLVRRGKRDVALSVRSGSNPRALTTAFLGVELMQVAPYKFPRQVKINTSDIGGPSAGMMFSLEIIAQVEPKAGFPAGRVVAGTGAITAKGEVQPIGGVAEKVITAYDSGATLFLCPKQNFAAARAVRQALHLPIRIVAVTTLSQALTAVGYSHASAQGVAG